MRNYEDYMCNYEGYMCNYEGYMRNYEGYMCNYEGAAMQKKQSQGTKCTWIVKTILHIIF